MIQRTMIDTGDNPARGLHVLTGDAVQEIIKKGCRRKKTIPDKYSKVCAYIFRSRYKIDFYLVARSTKPFGPEGLVSSQKWLIRRACKDQAPLVMYIKDLGLEVFHPCLSIMLSVGSNSRLGEKFVNWSSRYGLIWDETPLYQIWKDLKKQFATSRGSRDPFQRTF